MLFAGVLRPKRWQASCKTVGERRESKRNKERFMLPRVILIFVFLVLIVLAVKKGMNPAREIVEQVPGYPAPIALKKVNSISDEEFLKSLPSADDYSFSMNASNSVEEVKEKPVKVAKRKIKVTKRTVATKTKTKSKFMKR